MKESNELPKKKAPETENPKKKRSPAAPVIETPVPPQVMDPSVIPEIERKKTFGMRNQKSFKISRQ